MSNSWTKNDLLSWTLGIYKTCPWEMWDCKQYLVRWSVKMSTLNTEWNSWFWLTEAIHSEWPLHKDIHLQPVEDPTLEQLVAQRRPWPHGKPTLEWAPGRSLWTSGERRPHKSRSAGRTCDPTGDSKWNNLFLKDCTPQKGDTLQQFVKNCSAWKGLTLEKSMKDCLLWEGPHTGAEEECEESSSWGRSSCRDMWWSDHNLIPHPSCFWWGKGGENSVMEL